MFQGSNVNSGGNYISTTNQGSPTSKNFRGNRKEPNMRCILQNTFFFFIVLLLWLFVHAKFGSVQIPEIKVASYGKCEGTP